MTRRGRDDRGAVTIFTALFAVPALLMMMLVYEGGRYLEAQREARNAAVGAARVGAQEIDEEGIRRGERFNTLNPQQAESAACDYVYQTTDAIDCQPQATATEITVEVTMSVDVQVLNISQTVTQEGTACAEFGVTGSMGLCDD